MNVSINSIIQILSDDRGEYRSCFIEHICPAPSISHTTYAHFSVHDAFSIGFDMLTMNFTLKIWNTKHTSKLAGLVGVGVLLAADSQSTSSSGYRASLWDSWPDFILFFFLRMTITWLVIDMVLYKALWQSNEFTQTHGKHWGHGNEPDNRSWPSNTSGQLCVQAGCANDSYFKNDPHIKSCVHYDCKHIVTILQCLHLRTSCMIHVGKSIKEILCKTVL
jgi:hypothetical protein